jgi:hypothetical protein
MTAITGGCGSTKQTHYEDTRSLLIQILEKLITFGHREKGMLTEGKCVAGKRFTNHLQFGTVITN